MLEAAAAVASIDRLAVHEVPYDVADDWPERWRDYVEGVRSALREDRRGDALELFLVLTETPADVIGSIRASPGWPDMEAIAPTLAHDAACLGDGQPPASRLQRIARPTLVATGDAWRTPGSPRWVRALPHAADAIAAQPVRLRSHCRLPCSVHGATVSRQRVSTGR